MITLSPGAPGSGLKIELESTVMAQYGGAIRRVITETASEQGVIDVHIKAIDRGALDCTIRARMLTALARAGIELKEADAGCP
jgi:citrate lyase subunit gamma (acyl carrier protein)